MSPLYLPFKKLKISRVGSHLLGGVWPTHDVSVRMMVKWFIYHFLRGQVFGTNDNLSEVKIHKLQAATKWYYWKKKKKKKKKPHFTW